jgi:alkylation response protein AidB-like acyl-CoA dehydrogenase
MIDLSFSDEEQALREVVRDFVRREGSRTQVRAALNSDGDLRTWWLTFTRVRWVGLGTPERLGGVDASPLEVAIVFEELGRGAIPSPLLDSSLVSALLLQSCAPSKLRDGLLEELSAGSAIVIPGLTGPDATWASWMHDSVFISGMSSGATLTARKVFVRHADVATHFVVPWGTGTERNAGLSIVPANAGGVSYRRLAGALHDSYEVVFDEVPISQSNLLRWEPAVDLDRALALARLALSAYRAGGCDELLRMSIEHCTIREQFGQPIGRFQRVQDHVVRILNARDAARWTTYKAAAELSLNRDGSAYSHLAAAVSAESYVEAVNAAHEVFAAIGSDPEFGLTLFTAASRGLYDHLGSPRWHKRTMAAQFGWATDIGSPRGQASLP